jgi:hypothetical protein
MEYNMESVKNNINILEDIDYLVDNSIRHRDTYGLTNLKILFIFERLTPILAAEMNEKLNKDYFNKYGTRHRIFTSLTENYRNKLSKVGDIIIMGKLNNLLNYLRDKDMNTFNAIRKEFDDEFVEINVKDEEIIELIKDRAIKLRNMPAYNNTNNMNIEENDLYPNLGGGRKKRTHKKRTHKKRTHKKRTNKKRTHKKRTHKK